MSLHAFELPGGKIRADLSAEEIFSLLKGDFWKRILCYKVVGSTNDIAAKLGINEQDAGSGAVIISDAQEKGRGRLGRRWISPPGLNIYMSIVLRPQIVPRDAALLTILAGVASARGVRQATGAGVSIKWPNDLMASGKKVGGILTEARSDQGRISQAIIGVGINVNMECRNLPDGIAATVTSLVDETGETHSRTAIVAAILDEFEHWYKLLVTSGRSPLLFEWRRLSATIGKRVSVVTSRETLEGLAEDIDDEGMLVLRLSSGEKRVIGAGDVTMLR